MARAKNDGKGRLGGRAKGTPNKVSGIVKEWLSDLLTKNRKQIERDIKALSPKDRLLIFEKLMQYVISKQKTELEVTEIKPQDEITYDNIDLSCVPQDLLFKVADCIQEAQCQKLMRLKNGL